MENQRGQNLVLAPEAVLPLTSDPVEPQEEWLPLHEVPQRIGYGERRIKRALEAIQVAVEPRLRRTITGMRKVNSIRTSTLPTIKEWIEQDIARAEEMMRQGIDAPVEAPPQVAEAAALTVSSDTSVIASDASESVVAELRGQLAAKDALVKQLQSEITFLRSAFLKGQEMVATALSSRGPASP